MYIPQVKMPATGKGYKHFLVKKSQYDQASFYKLKIRLRIHIKQILAHYAPTARYE
jgi:hypothetical protein